VSRGVENEEWKPAVPGDQSELLHSSAKSS
jgi:hypothetical protein